MINKLINTFGTRVLSVVFQFLTVILTTQYLGKEGQGIISLLMAGIMFVMLASNIVGGTALVYLAPRVNVFQLTFPSYIWALICSVVGTILLGVFGLVPNELLGHLFFLSYISSLYTIHNQLIIGKEDILFVNAIALAQVFLVFSVLGTGLVFIGEQSIQSYIIALYIAFGCSFLLSFWRSRHFWNDIQFDNFGQNLKQLINYGWVAQLANIAQFMSYRLSLFVVEFYYGIDSVGLYSVGLRIAEALWIVPKSISFVLYARIVNLKDLEKAKQLTLSLAKISTVLTLLCLIPILLVPVEVFSWVFGKDFWPVKLITTVLAPGVASFGFSSIISQYFAGLGKYYVNTYAAIVGLVATVILNLLLVPPYNYVGAGIATSLAYLIMSLFKLFYFKYDTKLPLSSFLINRTDVQLFKEMIKNYRK